jgi:hypothetical protein
MATEQSQDGSYALTCGVRRTAKLLAGEGRGVVSVKPAFPATDGRTKHGQLEQHRKLLTIANVVSANQLSGAFPLCLSVQLPSPPWRNKHLSPGRRTSICVVYGDWVNLS